MCFLNLQDTEWCTKYQSSRDNISSLQLRRHNNHYHSNTDNRKHNFDHIFLNACISWFGVYGKHEIPRAYIWALILKKGKAVKKCFHKIFFSCLKEAIFKIYWGFWNVKFVEGCKIPGFRLHVALTIACKVVRKTRSVPAVSLWELILKRL